MKDARYKLYEDFQKEFPVETLGELPLERYTNLNRSDSFCYWVESKTYELGSIWGNTSYKFGIYEYNKKPNNPSVLTEDEKYAWYKKYNAKTREEAYDIVRCSIMRIANAVQAGNIEEVNKDDYAISGVFKWKVAFLYSNLKLVPIYKRDMLVNIARKLGLESSESKSIPVLQAFLMEQKGERDLFEFYDYLLTLNDEADKTTYTSCPTNFVTSDGPSYWLYSPGENASKWEEFYQDGTMGLGWDDLGNFKQYSNDNDLVIAIEEHYGGGGSHKNDKCAILDFAQKLKVGDIILVKQGRKKLIGRGVVLSDYYYDETQGNYRSRRKVEWTHKGEWIVDETLVMKTLTDISKYTGYGQKLESIMGVEVSEQSVKPIEFAKSNRHWWLNASPKVWKMSEWKVGEGQEYTLYNGNGNKRRIFQNFLEAVENDIVICYETNPVKKITTLAKVSKANDGERISFCKIETLTEPVDYAIIKDHPDLQQMEFLVNPNGSFFSLTENEFNVIMGIIRQNNDEEVESISSPAYTREDFLSEVYMNPDSYDELVELLKIKKNVILQGAPGVGKTFCAERLAYSIMGKKDERRIKTIQFHQSYSYEDFIMGYKPSGDSFKLRNGVFYNFCIEASNNPNEDYFFIIDEINRGNLSKIFGELLMMIEKDYRGKEITLAYSDQGFHVPDNLYIIGMMNTADRSLALIDYALRRRFSFFDMKPGFDSDGFKAHVEAVGKEKFEKVIKLISELNSEIYNDDSLGSGFEIGHSYFCGKPEDITDSFIEKIVKYDILPTIREYWFDNEKKALDWIEKLVKLLND